MWSLYNLFVLGFVACVVQASLISVNVLDNGAADIPEELDTGVLDNAIDSEVRSCNPSECNQRCRRIGFSGGVCVNDKCKCDLLKEENVLPTEEQSTPVEESAEVRSCNVAECNQRCKRLGFPGGVCVNGNCKCDNFREEKVEPTEEQSIAAEETAEVRSCNVAECNQRCKRLGFPGGVCVNGNCKCDNFRGEGVLQTLEEFIPLEETAEVRSCNVAECNQRCKRLGFPGGVCVNGNCKCDNFRVDVPAGGPSMLAEEDLHLRRCIVGECNQRCKRLGFVGGVCVNGQCKCDNFRLHDVLEPSMLAEEDVDLRSCYVGECNQRCKRLGFVGGVCVNGQCKCDNFRLRDLMLQSMFAEEWRSCDSGECIQRCKRLGFPGGACIGGRCKCDNLRLPYYDYRRCDVVACNNMCHRLGYAGGMCTGGSCKCY